MPELSDAAVERLRQVGGWPDLTGTRYSLVGEVGRGGMGAVYLVHDQLLDRRVALKVLAASRGSDDLAARLEREARVLGRLEHPGIVPVHDAGRLPDGRVFYAMKYVQGTRLDHHLLATPALPERLRVFLRVSEAIAFAHDAGVLHRDIKPENIMVGAFGEVLVLDWGIAKVRSETVADLDDTGLGEEAASPGNTQSGTVLGTPGYMAPEQASGQVDLVDERSDVFALGCLLQMVVVPDLLEAGPDAGAWPTNPRALSAIGRKAMAAEPDGRYRSAAEMAEDVANFLDRLPVSAYREPLWEQAWRVTRKYRTPIILVLAYLAVRLILLLARSD